MAKLLLSFVFLWPEIHLGPQRYKKYWLQYSFILTEQINFDRVCPFLLDEVRNPEQTKRACQVVNQNTEFAWLFTSPIILVGALHREGSFLLNIIFVMSVLRYSFFQNNTQYLLMNLCLQDIFLYG